MHPFRVLLLPLLLALLLGPAAAAVAVPTGDPVSDPVGEWPLRPVPEVVRGLDPPAEPWGAGHRGVDLRARPGQPVLAALPGEVSFAGLLAGRGVVVVDHGETRTTYEPVTPAVAVGDRVAAGGVLGALSPVGSHCPPGACLHWGWRRGEVYLDPLDLVGGGPVRLLPLWGDLPADAGAPAPSPPAALWAPPASRAPWSDRWAGWQPLARLPPLRPGGAPAGRRAGAGRW